MLSLDPTLEGKKICIWPSLTKFKAPNLTLELANRGELLPLFLNRQIVIILETLGLPQANFLQLLNIEISKLKRASTDFNAGRDFWLRYSLGQTSKLPRILKALQQWNFQGLFETPFFRRLLSLALPHALKLIKYRARIAVDDSWTLIGIMDEFNLLKEGELFVCLKYDDLSVRYLSGPTLLTRMPALHCGDVQTAIGQVEPGSPLASLYNCIVFSACGSRPIPNMLSGGDLDGDLYQVSQNTLLFPPTRKEPDDYPSVKPKELDRDCTMADIADFFVDFITNNRVGQICNMHVIQADQTPEGARDKDCVTLSRLAAQATDFPKTGHPVDMDAAPRVSMRPKPDFMSQRSEGSVDANGKRHYKPPDNTLYYRSEKALGRMYRAVNIQQLLDELIFNGKGNENGLRELWRDVERRLRNVKPPYQFEWPTYLAKAKSTFQYYITQLNIIKRRFHPRPWMGESLQEEEVFLQCIEIDADKKKPLEGSL